MHFESFSPSHSLKKLVKEYWVFENEDSTSNIQKIIPDGYSEIIIHYGKSYQINFGDGWTTQSKLLFSNQISKYFFLKNTGSSGMIGIKLHPVSLYELFEVDMTEFTDQVVSLESLVPDQIDLIQSIQAPDLSISERVQLTEKWLSSLSIKPQPKIKNAVNQILDSKGIIDIESIGKENEIGTRQLERLFKKVVGVSPKFYSRIIRFSNIFNVMDSDDQSWAKVALQSGYFDQSHFIKNFKEFTGEEPSKYGFDEPNLANFFLKN